jgi:hypothetical protein
MRRWLTLVAAIICAAQLLVARNSYADPFLPSDVQVSLGASKTRDIRSGDAITFTMTVRNNGPSTLGYFAITGPNVFRQFYYPGTNWNDCELLTDTGDSDFGPFWLLVWLPSGWSIENPVAPGETRTCHFTLTVAPGLPPDYVFKVELNSYFTDLNSTNNAAQVRLQRTVTAIPALSSRALVVLALLIVLSLRRWRRRTSGA